MAYGTIRADIIEGTNVTIDLSTAGQYEFGGDVLPDADNTRDIGSSSLRWQSLYANYANFGGDVVPSADSTHDLGTNSVRWANIYADNVYAGDLHLKNDKGDWTMVEAEDYLTLRNNKTGKTFRLVMEEVDS
jgi:hypothetical protein